MKNVQQQILDKVLEISKTHPGGEKFFDELDSQIIGEASPEMIEALFGMTPCNCFIVLSGGFGKKVAQMIDEKILPQKSYFLFQGGIRKGSQPIVLRTAKKEVLKKGATGVFLDDSIYGGATYRAIQKFMKDELSLEVTKCNVIYDGCPVKKSDIEALFRYYDHFQATPNYNF